MIRIPQITVYGDHIKDCFALKPYFALLEIESHSKFSEDWGGGTVMVVATLMNASIFTRRSFGSLLNMPNSSLKTHHLNF